MMNRIACGCFALAALSPVVNAAEVQVQSNPIRKVVNMLQSMSKKVSAEGEKAKDLHEKYLCYCKTGVATLQKGIEAAEDKIPELLSAIKAATEKEAKMKEEHKEQNADRASAKAAMSEATAMREKENAAFKAERDEYEANLSALAKATAAIENGMAGSFLQTPAKQTLQKVLDSLAVQHLTADDRQAFSSFLEQGYAPAGGEVVGIMKTMSDEMTAGLEAITKEEAAALNEYNSLMGAKTKEVKALTAAIEKKLEELGEQGVKIVQLKNDAGDTAEGFEEDKKFLADLEKGCATATEDYEADAKMRNEELAALADTIKILNDDDALELFKKTLPGASSFVQLQVSSELMRQRALAVLRAASKRADGPHHRRQLDLMSLALHGKKIGFDGVIKMIDDMIATLTKEQEDDLAKKEYCEKEFDLADDKKKALEKTIKDLITSITNTEEGIATTKDEIKALTDGITELDQQVVKATAQRKEENAEYKDLMASDGAAKEILGFAKNRLNKFYNPKLYKPPAKEELSSEDRIVSNMGGASLAQGKVAPPPPPETAAAYSKKSGDSQGVIAMIDLLVADLDKEMQIAKTEETDAQGDYEGFLADSQEKRTTDSKTLVDKEGTLAEMESALETAKVDKKSNLKDLASTQQYIAALHADCDWLVQYFAVRKEARTGEIDALGKAKAVLSGADFSLVQTRAARRNLRAGVISA